MIKHGVKLKGIQPEMAIAYTIIVSIYQKFNQVAVITSAFDGTHKENSKHYTGNAIDIRCRMFTSEEKQMVTNEIRNALGGEFDVVNEIDHIHIEFDPK